MIYLMGVGFLILMSVSSLVHASDEDNVIFQYEGPKVEKVTFKNITGNINAMPTEFNNGTKFTIQLPSDKYDSIMTGTVLPSNEKNPPSTDFKFSFNFSERKCKATFNTQTEWKAECGLFQSKPFPVVRLIISQ